MLFPVPRSVGARFEPGPKFERQDASCNPSPPSNGIQNCTGVGL
jgi:hypothetical protein